MKIERLIVAAAFAVMIPSVAIADDPNDPAMRSAAARARDHEMIRELNRQELASVQARDARYAEGWRAVRAPEGNSPAGLEYAERSRDYQRAMQDYASERDMYARRMAQWRRATEACYNGDYSACGN